MGKLRNAYRGLVGRPQDKRYLADTDVDWRIILKLNLEKWDEVHGLECSASGHEQVVSACKCGNDTIGFREMLAAS